MIKQTNNHIIVIQALEALSKKDISEIRSFTRPPPKVEMVMEAVMILKNSEPSWAESKRQLADVNFLATVTIYTIYTHDPPSKAKFHGPSSFETSTRTTSPTGRSEPFPSTRRTLSSSRKRSV